MDKKQLQELLNGLNMLNDNSCLPKNLGGAENKQFIFNDEEKRAVSKLVFAVEDCLATFGQKSAKEIIEEVEAENKEEEYSEDEEVKTL